jgi:hypothetical protein
MEAVFFRSLQFRTGTFSPTGNTELVHCSRGYFVHRWLSELRSAPVAKYWSGLSLFARGSASFTYAEPFASSKEPYASSL